MYLKKVTLNDPIYLDPDNYTRAICAFMGKRAAEATQCHTLALICRKIEWQQRYSKTQHKDFALGSNLGSIN